MFPPKKIVLTSNGLGVTISGRLVTVGLSRRYYRPPLESPSLALGRQRKRPTGKLSYVCTPRLGEQVIPLSSGLQTPVKNTFAFGEERVP